MQLGFEFVVDRPVVVQCSVGRMTSDAGLLPLRELDRKWRFTERMAGCLNDLRKDSEHSMIEMLRQRLFGIVADYEDCNDHDDLRSDPLFHLLTGLSPDEGSLASQPTLSRFENSITPATLNRLIDFSVITGVERIKHHHHGELPTTITLDIDPTDDLTHGNQQLTMFHGYYDQCQYYPHLVGEPTTKHVFLAVLRHGTASASLGVDVDVLRVIQALRAASPEIAIHLGADAGPPHLNLAGNPLDSEVWFGFDGIFRGPIIDSPEKTATFRCGGPGRGRRVRRAGDVRNV